MRIKANGNPAFVAHALTEKALDEIRASFRKDRRVYVRAFTRIGPRVWFNNPSTYEAERKALAEAKAEGQAW